MRALVVCAYFLGNSVQKFHFICALHKQGYAVDVVADSRPILGEKAKEVFELCPCISTIYEFDGFNIPLITFDYDLVIAPLPNDKSFSFPIFDYLKRLECKAQYIFPDNPQKWEKHEVQYNFDLISAQTSYIMLDKLHSSQGTCGLNIGIPYIVFGIGYKHEGLWYRKHYPEKCWAELANFIDKRTIILGGKEDYVNAELIKMYSRNRQLENWCGRTTIKESATIICNSVGYVGNDTGLSHLSAVYGIPTLTLFSFTSIIKNGPIGIKSNYMQIKPDECPCQGGRKDKCKYPKCFETLKPIDVYNKFKDIL